MASAHPVNTKDSQVGPFFNYTRDTVDQSRIIGLTDKRMETLRTKVEGRLAPRCVDDVYADVTGLHFSTQPKGRY